MDWKEVSLTSENVRSSYSYFDGALGLNYGINVVLTFFDESNKQVNFYIQWDDGHFSQYSKISLDDLKYKLLIPKPAAVKRECSAKSIYGGVWGPEYKINDFQDFVPYKIKVNISGQTTGKHIYLELNSIREISKIKIWMYKGRIDELIYPELNDIKSGTKLYNDKLGIVTIDKIYDRSTSIPSHDFSIIDNEGKKHDVVNKKDGFYKLPSDGYKQNIFNDFLNETKLDARISIDRQFNLINIYWQQVEEAACYKIKFYKKYRDHYQKIDQLHFLKEIEVERNNCCLSVNDLVTSNIVIVVIAEDRNGAIIAKTRGITDDIPREFTFEGE